MTDATPDPALAAGRLAALPGRLRKRAATLTVGEPVDGTVTVGSETVTLADLTCTCLLSPRCAHVGAVCLTVPQDAPVQVADAVPAGTVTRDAPGAPGAPGTPVLSTAGEDAPGAGRPVRVDTTLVTGVRDLLGEVLRHGLTDLPLACAVSLEAALQQVRVARLHRLERALTGVVTAATALRDGHAVNRADVTVSVTGALLTCHLLLRGDPAAVGTARRVYGDLGSAVLVPVGARPVLTASGFAGASVLLAGPEGIYTLGRTPPGGRADVPRIWHGPAGIGDIRASLKELTRHKVLVSGATVSTDGRLGSGRSVRAVLGTTVALDDVRAVLSGASEPAPTVLTGVVRSASRKGVDLDCPSGIERAVFSRASRACGVDGLVDRLRGLCGDGDAVATAVTVVVAEGEAVAVWFGEEVVVPGLDRVTGPEIPDKGPDSDDTPVAPLAAPAVPTPAGRLADRLELLVFGGARVLDGPALSRDAAWCERNGAPLAGELLRGLTAEIDRVLPAVVYIHG